jgi:4-hydroxy-tetrahydrodipicolinate reductase
MNIAIIGYGKMGKILEALASEQGDRIGAVVDPFYDGEKSASGAPVYRDIPGIFGVPGGGSPEGAGGSPDGAGGIDVALEFTGPGTALSNIKALAERRIPTVVGTTGWQDRLAEADAAVQGAGSSLLWASNFSLGINLFYRIAAFAARLADPFPEYDAAGYEVHHNKKADSPSGTARTLAELVIKNMGRKTTAVYEMLNRPPRPEELHYASLRLGAAPGVHTLIFDSPADSIEIIHSTRNREGLARGALLAARWLVRAGPVRSCPVRGGPGRPGRTQDDRTQEAGKPRRGIFTMDDVLAELLEDSGASSC